MGLAAGSTASLETDADAVRRSTYRSSSATEFGDRMDQLVARMTRMVDSMEEGERSSESTAEKTTMTCDQALSTVSNWEDENRLTDASAFHTCCQNCRDTTCISNLLSNCCHQCILSSCAQYCVDTHTCGTATSWFRRAI